MSTMRKSPRPQHGGGRRTTAAALATALACATGAASADGPLRPPPGYRLVWADEFDRDGPPDPAKWVHDTSRNREGWFNGEKQYYVGPTLDNARVSNGRLLITARKESVSQAADWGGQRYTSARLITRGRAAWTYGFFEVSARLPCGRGTWPAIWMLGSGGRWPEDGELDIMEHVGHDPKRTTSAVHVAAGHGGQYIGGAAPVPDACQAFHRYQMHWTPDGVSFGVDGFVHLRYPKLDLGPRAWPFDAPQYLLLNLAIGGHLGGEVDDSIFPVTMEVDYVRVYQKQPEAASERSGR
jgi:beta-glucanase (GH16 family)